MLRAPAMKGEGLKLGFLKRGLRPGLPIGVISMLLVVIFAGFASAGGKPTFTFVSPSPSEGATLASNSVSFAFTYNRTPKQVKNLTCTLSGPIVLIGCLRRSCCVRVGVAIGQVLQWPRRTARTRSRSRTVVRLRRTRHFTINVPTARHIYWTNYYGSNSDAIGRANVDGSNVNQSFITGSPGPASPAGVAVDANYVYWTNYGSELDRPGEPGRVEREPELHHRRLRSLGVGGRFQLHLLDRAR